MRGFVGCVAGAMLAAGAASGPAAAATLAHAYDFSSGVTDLVGGAHGTLHGDAATAGGLLQLDGNGDWVSFGQNLIPLGVQDFSVYLRVQGERPGANFAEIISQGHSGLPGFYIGVDGDNIRVTDSHHNTGVPFPFGAAFHDLLLVNSHAQSQLRFYLDGQLVLTASPFTMQAGGDLTRLGHQYDPFAEWWNGDIDTLKVFHGAATLAEATAPIPAPGIPEPSSWALMILGFGSAGAALRRRSRPRPAL